MAEDFYIPFWVTARSREHAIASVRVAQATSWLALLHGMSPELQMNVITSSLIKHIDYHPCFAQLEVALRVALVLRLKPILYEEKEYICTGGPCKSGLFVISGVACAGGTLYGAGSMYGLEILLQSGRYTKPLAAMT